MKKSIVEKSKEVLDKHIVKDSFQLEMYLKTSELNKQLIKDGLSKPRGYNLLTTEEICNQSLNTNFTQNF